MRWRKRGAGGTRATGGAASGHQTPPPLPPPPPHTPPPGAQVLLLRGCGKDLLINVLLTIVFLWLGGEAHPTLGGGGVQ